MTLIPRWWAGDSYQLKKGTYGKPPTFAVHTSSKQLLRAHECWETFWATQNYSLSLGNDNLPIRDVGINWIYGGKRTTICI